MAVVVLRVGIELVVAVNATVSLFQFFVIGFNKSSQRLIFVLLWRFSTCSRHRLLPAHNTFGFCASFGNELRLAASNSL